MTIQIDKPRNITEVVTVTTAWISVTPCTLFDVAIAIDFHQRLTISANAAIDAIIPRTIEEKTYTNGDS
nr:hypothetical protein [Pseudomonas asturiensis]